MGSKLITTFFSLPLYILSTITVWLDWLTLNALGVTVHTTLWEDDKSVSRYLILIAIMLGTIIAISKIFLRNKGTILDIIGVIIALAQLTVSLFYYFGTKADAKSMGQSIEPSIGFYLMIVILVAIISVSIVNLSAPFREYYR